MAWSCKYCSTGNKDVDKYCFVCDHRRSSESIKKDLLEKTTSLVNLILKISFYGAITAMIISFGYYYITMKNGLFSNINTNIKLFFDSFGKNLSLKDNLKVVGNDLKTNIKTIGQSIDVFWNIFVVNLKELLS